MPAISRMQFHAVEFPASGLTVDINLTHAVDQSRTAVFVVPYMFPTGPIHSPDRAQCYPTFVDNSTVRLHRVYSGIYGATYWNNVWVVEFDPAYVTNVQRGTFDPTGANTDITVTSVDTSYTLPIVHCTTINSPHASWSAYFTSPTNLRVQTNGEWSAGQMPGSYQLIEFASVNMRPIQAISTTLTNSGLNALETHNITIPTDLLDISKTWVGCHGHWNTGFDHVVRSKFTCEIPDLTTLRLKRWGSTGFQPVMNMRFYVVEMTDNSRVRNDSEFTIDVSLSTEDYAWTEQDSSIAFAPMVGIPASHHRLIADNSNGNKMVGHQLANDTTLRRHATSDATQDTILRPQFVEIIEGGAPVELLFESESAPPAGHDSSVSVAPPTELNFYSDTGPPPGNDVEHVAEAHLASDGEEPPPHHTWSLHVERRLGGETLAPQGHLTARDPLEQTLASVGEECPCSEAAVLVLTELEKLFYGETCPPPQHKAEVQIVLLFESDTGPPPGHEAFTTEIGVLSFQSDQGPLPGHQGEIAVEVPMASSQQEPGGHEAYAIVRDPSNIPGKGGVQLGLLCPDAPAGVLSAGAIATVVEVSGDILL